MSTKIHDLPTTPSEICMLMAPLYYFYSSNRIGEDSMNTVPCFTKIDKTWFTPRKQVLCSKIKAHLIDDA